MAERRILLTHNQFSINQNSIYKGMEIGFSFDPTRRGILLICGDKSGGSEKRFYKDLIKKADQRFDKHLSNLKRGEL